MTIVHLLSKLFNIRTHEWPRLLFLYAMFLAVNMGLVWGETILEASFILQVGMDALPVFYVVRSVLSVLAVAVYTAFADRVSNDKLLIIILGLSVLGSALGLVLLGGGMAKLAYPLLYMIIFVPLDDVFFTHWYTYVNGFYDTRSAKRIVPILGTGGRIAGITAGLTMPVLNRFLAPNAIVMLYLSALVTMAGLAWLMPRLVKDKAAELPGGYAAPGKAHPSYLDNLREGYHYVLQSAYLRWLALASLLMMLLFAFVQYQTYQILLDQLQTTQGISNFTGRLTALTNLIILPFQLFLLSRLIGRIGLGNATMIFPGGTLAICGGLVFLPSLPTAALAYFNRTNFYGAIGAPINSLLYNAVPLRVKGRARAFIGGLVMPVGVFIGGNLLLGLQFGSALGMLPTLIGALALAYALTMIIVRQQYGRALIAMLEQENFTFLVSQEASTLSVADPAALAQLQKKLEESTSHELTVFIAKLISQVGGSKALPILGQAARAAQDARTRSALVDVLAAADLRGDAVRQLYTDFLADPEPQVRQSAIAGLEQLAAPSDKLFLSQMLAMVQDPALDVQVRVLSALVRFARDLGGGDFHQWTPAAQALDQLLADADPGRRARGVRVLGQIGDEHAIRHLADYMTDPDDQVRLEAILAVESMAHNGLTEPLKPLVADKASRLLRDPVERIRQAALTILGQIGTRDSHQALVDSLADPSPPIRETAADVLVHIGKSIIPTLHPKLNSPEPQLRKMATVTLSRIDPREFGALVGSNITGNLLMVYRNYGRVEALRPCAGYPSMAVLQSALREQNQRLLDEIFYLMTAIHEPGAVKVIRESIRSDVPRIRANAIEALETLITAQTANLIAPLFEPDLPPAQVLALGQETWDMEPPNTTQALKQLATDPDDPWLRAITAFALGEMGAALAEAEARQPRPAEGGEPTGRRARRSSDLLGALVDKTEAKAPPPVGPSLPEIQDWLQVSLADPVKEVHLAAQAALRVLAGRRVTGAVTRMTEEDIVLSTIEKIIFLKEVPFFQGMTIEQLKVLANVCEEEMFEQDTRIYNENDPGGVLYVVVSGRVGIEQEKRSGSFARLANIEAHSYFGEMNLFDNSPRSTSAVAIQDTLTLRLRREPLIALARQHPDLSLELINVLSQRLRETSDRIAELTRTRPRELHKLFDQFD